MRLFLAAMTLLASLVANSVHADLYGFVDEQGQVHLANRQVDERYQLYQKSMQSGTGNHAALDDAIPPGLDATLSSDRRQTTQRVDKLKPASVPVVNSRLAAQYKPLVDQTAREFKLDADLLHSIVAVESGYNPQAISPKGAIGLMQVIPATGERFGVTSLAVPGKTCAPGRAICVFC